MSEIMLEALKELHNQKKLLVRENKRGSIRQAVVEELVLDSDTDPSDVIDFDEITDEQIESDYPPFIENIDGEALYEYGWHDDSEDDRLLARCVEKWIKDRYPGKLDTSKPIPYLAEPLNDGPICIELLGPLHWLDQDVSKKDKVKEIEEDFNSSKPVTPLPVADVKQFIANLPNPSYRVPPVFFKLGYMREVPVASKYRGGRGWTEDTPIVRILKCTEFSSVYTGSAWASTGDTKAVDKLLGAERHTGERTNFQKSSEDQYKEKIGVYPNGKEALQAYISKTSGQKVKFFISINDGDLQEASREEVAQYVTSKEADNILNPREIVHGVNMETGEVGAGTPVSRFLIDQIYMIGNLGRSVF